jgi:hypothetical protein
MEKLNRIMEHVWLAIAIASLIWAAVEINRFGWEQGKSWLYVPGIAAAMFMFRRFTRKKMDAYKAREEERQRHSEE